MANAVADRTFRPDAVGPQAFDHPVRDLQTVETHISWVFLTGDFAYKVHKPVRYDFVNFSTLDRRRRDCAQELRLNRRFAPHLYLDVVPIGGTPDAPRFGHAPAFEYAVRMRQFDPAMRLDRLLGNDALDRADARALGVMLAGMQARMPRAPAGSPWARSRCACAPIIDNYRALRDAGPDPAVADRLRRLCAMDLARLRRLRPVLARRGRRGFVREGHGDLHLANLARIDGRIVAFDCLEFDAALRWIDLTSEVAFPYVDFCAAGRPDLAHEFVDAWAEASGDYDGIGLLDLYATYRCLVRAKVGCLRHDGAGRDMARRYLDQAERFLTRPPPLLIVTHGLSASGKSHLAARLVGPLRAIRLRTDVERKRLAGLSALAHTHSGPGQGLYSEAMTRRTHRRIARYALRLVAAGHTAIVDGTFLTRRERRRFARMAAGAGVPLVWLDCQAPEATLRRRIERRLADDRDPSEADQSVLDLQLRMAEPLSAPEREHAVAVDTTTPTDCAALAAALRRKADLPDARAALARA